MHRACHVLHRHQSRHSVIRASQAIQHRSWMLTPLSTNTKLVVRSLPAHHWVTSTAFPWKKMDICFKAHLLKTWIKRLRQLSLMRFACHCKQFWLDYRSSSLSTACALALGSATAHLHPTDTQTRQDVLGQLMHSLMDHPRSSFTSACAESLGLLAASSSSSAQPTSADSALAVQIWEGLLRMLCMLCPDVLAAVRQLMESSSGWLNVQCLKGLQSSNGNDDEACETVRGVMSGESPSWDRMPNCHMFVSVSHADLELWRGYMPSIPFVC